jgi:glycine cleavage system aminomethyltransferase T
MDENSLTLSVCAHNVETYKIDSGELWCAAVQGDGGKTEMEVHDDRSLLALQGPLGAEVLQPHVETDLSKLYFSNFIRTSIAGIPCVLTRTGYPPPSVHLR